MLTPSRTPNLRRSARANWLHSSSSVHSTTIPLSATTSRATPAETLVTMTMNAARPMNHPDSRWMTASQVRVDTTACSAVTGSPAHATADLMSAAAICRSPPRLSAPPPLGLARAPVRARAPPRLGLAPRPGWGSLI